MKKKNGTTVLLVLILIIGLSLLLYPTVSNYWNSFHQSSTIRSLDAYTENLSNEEYEKIMEQANEYNKALEESGMRWKLSEEDREKYWSTLNFDGNGAMGYIEIQKINVSLPIYHGTDEKVLQIGIGHIDASSLPVGGKGTHCVLSGHRGLPSAKLFSNLDQLDEGDIFTLTVLDQVLTYEIDQIRVVEPNDIDSLEIDPEEDLCTLVTCTPYGVNTHRMLVRGHRVANAPGAIHVQGDALVIDEEMVAMIIVITIIIVMALGAAVQSFRRKPEEPVEAETEEQERIL